MAETRTTRLLRQNPADAAKWEALEALYDNSGNLSSWQTKELDTPQAERWHREGGFEIVPAQRYVDALKGVSSDVEAKQRADADYKRKLSGPEWLPLDAEDEKVMREPPPGASTMVAMQRQAEGKPPASGFGGEAGGLKGLGDLSDLEEQQRRFQQGLRLFVDKPSAGGQRARPQVDVSAVGAAPAMRGFQSLAEYAPREADGAHISTAQASVGRDTSSKPPGDAEFAAAQADADRRGLAVALGRAGAQVNQAISGQGYDEAAYKSADEVAASPVARLLVQREADKRKALEDPTSEQSKRVQAAVAKSLPGIYAPEELARITAADADMVTKYGAMRQRLEERKADVAREDALRAAQQTREDTIRKEGQRFQAQQAGAARSFQASQADKAFARQKELAALNNAADLAQVQARANIGPDGQPVSKGTVIPGLEVEPGAAPTAEDAKKVKTAMVAAEKIRGLTGQLRALHQRNGTEYGGTAGTNMGQLATAIQIEAKTIAELGALSGPDQALMESLAGADPSTFWANAKAVFGVDNTQAALDQLEKWVGTQVGAVQRVYGYRPSRGQQASGGGDMVPMVDPQGRQRMVPKARVQDALAAGGRLVNG